MQIYVKIITVLFLYVPINLQSQGFKGIINGKNYEVDANLLKKKNSERLAKLPKKKVVYIKTKICGDTLVENITREDGSFYSRSIQFGKSLYLKTPQDGSFFKFIAPKNYANEIPIAKWKKTKKIYKALGLDYSTTNPKIQTSEYFITIQSDSSYSTNTELGGLFSSKFHPDGTKVKSAVTNGDFFSIRENEFIYQSDLVCKDLINDFWIKDEKEAAVHWTEYNNAIATNADIIPSKDRRGLPPAEFQDEFEEAVFLDQFLGKYVYIDFWASWCSPCRAEMPFTKKIRDRYQDKGLEVISITIDQAAAKPKWRDIIEKLEMDWHNWYLEYGKDSSLAKGIKLEGIPRYILLDPEGKIMNDHAPRPSDAGLIEFLDQVLEEDKN